METPSTATVSSCQNCGSDQQIRSKPSGKRRKGHRLLHVVKAKKRKFIPWASVIALIVTWIGLFLFCTRLYVGMQDLEDQSKGLFNFLIPYLHYVRQATIISAIIMITLTAMMAIVGFFATIHCHHSYRGRMSSCVCSKFGSRVMCAIFWILSYLLNFFWMGILSCMVVMTSAYFAFLPVCLPQSGMQDSYCLNFTILSNLMTGASNDNSVNLLLCGGAIDKLCKLTKAILPWYWGAYLGCLAVLLGLSHFNGSLAANFAHGKHAYRYKKIRNRTSHAVEWTKDWRVKSFIYFDSTTDSTVTLRKKSIRPSLNGSTSLAEQNGKIMNGHVPNGHASNIIQKKKRDSTTCSSETETESEMDLEKSAVDVKTSTGSIVLSIQRNGSAVVPVKMNGDLRSPPPLPPYKPRPSSVQSLPMPPYKPRSASMISNEPVPVHGRAMEEVRV